MNRQIDTEIDCKQKMPKFHQKQIKCEKKAFKNDKLRLSPSVTISIVVRIEFSPMSRITPNWYIISSR